jgi:small subunit ribosomal protein S13
MVFLFGIALKKDNQLLTSLKTIKGIGFPRSFFIMQQLGFGFDVRVNMLSRNDIYILKGYLSYIFVLDLDRKRKIQKFLVTLSEIGCYRGMRHKLRLPVRGQRTHSNGHTVKKLA